VIQFNAVKKQFVATCKVPIPDTRESEDQTFKCAVRKPKADLQFA
jgi:hypothetical protein